jgi:alkylation response protein AidB-like acyl-CoA dehydrogenase
MTNRAQAVAAIAKDCAEAGDRDGQLAAPVVDAFHREGVLGMWVPCTLRGGLELGPLPSMDVLEQVSYADASAGWVLMAACLATGTGGAYLGDEAVAELFSKDRLPVIAGQGTRPGTATPVAGGFRLTGSWSFASGIKHGTHIHTLGVVPDTGEARIFVLPVGQATLLDNWDVMGLRATGSIDYRIDDVFVPEAFTHPAITETPRRGGRIYSLGIIGLAILCHSASSPPRCRPASAAPARWPAARRSTSSTPRPRASTGRPEPLFAKRGAT